MPSFALEGLGVLGKDSCYETDIAACRVLREHHPGVVVKGSVAERTPSSLHKVDAVVAGFPCQPFSRLGLRCGVHDARGRGTLVEHTLAYVRCHLPPIVILENVASFRTVHDGAALAWLLHELEIVNGYRVTHRVICTSRFGLPQTRRRWYLVGIRPEVQAAAFAWPSEIDPIPLRVLLGPRPPDASAARRPGPDSGLAARNVAREVARLAKPGVDVDTLHRIVDCDASSSWCGHSKTFCPCLTRSRRQGL